MATILSKDQTEILESRRILKEKARIDELLKKFNNSREKLIYTLNRDRADIYVKVLNELMNNEDGDATNLEVDVLQIEESIEQLGFTIDRKETLGEGRFSQVYKAVWKDKAKTIAVKVVRFKDMCSNFGIKDLERQARTLIFLNHPKLLKCIKAFYIPNTNKLYLFTAFAEAGNLSQFIERQQKPLTLNQAKSWLKDVLEALSFLHSFGLAHRRLIPVNVLLFSSATNMNVKLNLPDSFSSVVEILPGHKFQIITSNALQLSSRDLLPYFAPEVLFGKDHDPIQADMWAVGSLLYYMLVMRAPLLSWYTKDALREELDTARWQYAGIIDKSPKLNDGAKLFFFNLFKENPSERLTAIELLTHSWMKI